MIYNILLYIDHVLFAIQASKVEWSEGCDHREPKAKVPQGWICCKVHRQQVKLFGGTQEAKNIILEGLHDNKKMKLSSNSGQHGEEGRDQERNLSALWPIRKTLDNQGNKEIYCIGIMVRVFANSPGDWGSIPGQVIPKTQKMILHAALLSTQHL